jgi:nucleotide-binding universal stress UspA family protein
MLTLTLHAMRPILCVIDLTKSSAAVLDTAVRIARAFKAHLVILFPYRLINYTYTGELSAVNLKLVNDAKAKFDVLKQNGEIASHFSYEFLPEIGFSYDRIVSFLNTSEADMVVIGQQQANAMNELNTSTLQDLIKNSKLPFTIVPETTHDSSLPSPDLNHFGLPV